MEKQLSTDYSKYGFPSAPKRRTIRRRLKSLPPIIMYMMPQIARYCYTKVCHKAFNLRWLFSDKSIFRANGGLWHKAQMDEGLVPHPSIDTDASWAKSPYHGWRFGYALMIVCNQKRFPVAVIADTATLNEPSQLALLLKPIAQFVGIVVGDAAYKVYDIIKKLFDNHNILLLVKGDIKDKAMAWYKDLVHNTWANLTYAKRKPSIEPVFSLIKELFNLKGDDQLPYKGKQYVIPFLCITAIAIQIMMIYNHHFLHKFGDTQHFKQLF
jgi:hypothetical protein